MKLSEVKEALQGMNEVIFRLEDGTRVPQHFHVTEVGSVNRHFIDCGGSISKETVVNFQLWTANDFDHRLATTKLLNIIQLSEEKLGLTDAEVEVEYEVGTTGIYHLALRDNEFVLVPKHTDCRAKSACDIPEGKQKLSLGELGTQSCCTPGEGCC